MSLKSFHVFPSSPAVDLKIFRGISLKCLLKIYKHSFEANRKVSATLFLDPWLEALSVPLNEEPQ